MPEPLVGMCVSFATQEALQSPDMNAIPPHRARGPVSPAENLRRVRMRIPGNRPSGDPSRAGFTLVEVLVTLVILSLGIVLILRAFETSLFALGEARDGLWASTLIKQKLAETEGQVLENSTAPSSEQGRFSSSGMSFHWARNVEEITAKPESQKDGALRCKWYEVEVSVWREGTRTRHSATTLLCVREGNESKL